MKTGIILVLIFTLTTSLMPIATAEPIQTATISTHMAGENPLDALPSPQPILTYQNATVTLYIGAKEYYAIYLGNQLILNNTGSGVINYNMTLPKGANTVSVVLGNETLTFHLTVITRTIQAHFSAPKVSLIAGLETLIMTLIKGIGASMITIVIMALALIPPIIRKKESEPQVW